MMGIFSVLLQIVLFAFPWFFRRWVLCRILGFRLARSSKIGWSVIIAEQVMLGEHAWIGHLNFLRGLSRLSLDEYAIIGNHNWITGMPLASSTFFELDETRDPALTLGPHAAITNRHLIDCSDQVTVGRFSIIAGWRSQMLSHSIDLAVPRQRARPVRIGAYCFVGTSCVILPGAILPDYCVLGANSTLSEALTKEHTLYSGSPARAVKALPSDYGYFVRQHGYVV